MDEYLVKFNPSNEDRLVASEYCNKVIDVLSPLRLEMKAFVLKTLMDGFEDTLKEIHEDGR